MWKEGKRFVLCVPIYVYPLKNKVCSPLDVSIQRLYVFPFGFSEFDHTELLEELRAFADNLESELIGRVNQ